MNLIFDLDDTLYDLMGPFELVHKKLYADKTDADCTELFIKSRDYSDEIMEAEIKGDIPHEDCFYERIKRTYHDVGIEMNREDTEEFERLYRAYQKEISLSEGVEEFLDYCKAHNIFIAILTNGRPKSQYAKVIALDLHRWFDDDHIFISKRCFHLIRKKHGILEILMRQMLLGQTVQAGIQSGLITATENVWKTVLM